MDANDKKIVNSWNEWDPLKRVVVGRADNCNIQAPEPAYQPDYRKDGLPLGMYGRHPEEAEEKAKELLDNFAKILEKRGIIVDRPTPIDFSQQVQTPDWVQKNQRACMAPRDVLMTVGNEILEATMSRRARFFEYICYREILNQYFNDDPNMKWNACPKPRLTDRTYKEGFWKEWRSLSSEQKLERARKRDWALTEVEPVFDAADVGRFGKDLFIHHSTLTNNAGIEWIKRHFPDHRTHIVAFDQEYPFHIDSTFVPLRPGLVLQNYTRPPLGEELHEFFRKNGWEIVECAKPAHERGKAFSGGGNSLAMNLLVIDPKTVCVEASETAQIEQLDKLGFEVVPVPFRDVGPFGGGLHCATADVYRDGTCEDYFPKQIPGF
ncbi:arginine deiminase family protein [Ruegeria sp. HKCCD8929]|uniref:arginine deiminase family protein n=1 Tax=Ruegeria sp. HKCCD8929 TaxID=2683006 RepID=UPI0014880A44|nr:arginine deiminase family protein [Ruegeria sp. HKCCD8929]